MTLWAPCTAPRSLLPPTTSSDFICFELGLCVHAPSCIARDALAGKKREQRRRAPTRRGQGHAGTSSFLGSAPVVVDAGIARDTHTRMGPRLLLPPSSFYPHATSKDVRMTPFMECNIELRDLINAVGTPHRTSDSLRAITVLLLAAARTAPAFFVAYKEARWFL